MRTVVIIPLYLLSFSVFALVSIIGNSARAQGRLCQSVFERRDSVQQPLRLDFSQIRDIDALLKPPRFRHLEARPIHVSEVQAFVGEISWYISRVRQIAKGATEEEKLILEEAAEFTERTQKGFLDGYSSFDPTSHLRQRLFFLNNFLQGKAFETLLAISLHRMGFSEMARAVPPGPYLQQHLGLRDNQKDQSLRGSIYWNQWHNKTSLSQLRGPFEVDVLAQKDGRIYLFEAKSIDPSGNGFSEENLHEVYEQISTRDSYLKFLGIRDKVTVVLVHHYDLGPLHHYTSLANGADEVISFRASD